MLSSEKQAIIREIWNNRFNIHSLRPLQSKVTHVTEDHGVLKFHVEHQVLPSPLPAEIVKQSITVRKRELKFKPQPLSAALQERQIRTITVSKHLPLEEALIKRLKQCGIIINELTLEKAGDRKSVYRVKVIRSPYISTAGVAKLTIQTAGEDLLSTEFLDGDYNSSSKLLRLHPTSYSSTIDTQIRYFYGSICAWSRNGDYLKVKILEDTHLNLYGVTIGDLNDYKYHLELINTQPILSEEFKAEDHFELKFNENETLFIKDGETKVLPPMDKRIALGVTNSNVLARDFKLEITSMEQV